MAGVIAYLGIGGNLGDVRSNFLNALQNLRDHPACRVLRISPLYRTEPWGGIQQPDFLNLVVEIKWDAPLLELFEFIRAIETAAGRVRVKSSAWGPRTLDLDILLFGSQQCDEKEIIIPHPRMRERRFVLAPLADLAPDLTPPGWNCTIQEALLSCIDPGIVERLSQEIT